MPNNLLTFLPHVSMATLLSTTVARLTLSAALGGIIGLEREFKHRPAGLRTNMFICFGAAMFTILSEQLVGDSAGEHTRIASQIIPGIGFIGAGSILHAKGSVTGLTTAATIFVVASIGMACGGGLYLVALFATLLILMALQALGWLERRLNLKPLVMNYSLVTSKSAEEPADLHKVGREFDHLRLFASRTEDRGGNRISVHIETDYWIVNHGWTPFPVVEWTHSLM